MAVASQAHAIINEDNRKMLESGDYSLRDEANNKLCEMAKKETINTINKLILEASKAMKNGYSRSDN